mmetsp:Transcript_19921/g.51200  ORF Transcript_19921/g.51200 Transcript_19921/m.51200 type:complete len:132 (+) Transcript_19921:170-565(+)
MAGRRAPLGDLTRHRTSPPLPLRFTASGTLTAFAVYFSLDLDGEPANTFDSGPANADLIAWDQSVRSLPVHCHVRAGQELHVVANHTEHFLQTLRVLDLPPSMVGDVGFPGLVGNPHGSGLVVALDCRGSR